jgi:transposase
VRATTAFNKMLVIEGASVRAVDFTCRGVEVGLRLRARRLRCPCGWSTRAVYDRSRRRWRHLDLGAAKLFLVAEIRRLHCRRCGRVRTEQVPWARPDAWFTRDFEDVVTWLAQRTDKTTVATLMRCSWAAVAAIVTRVVADHVDDARLEDLYRIGVDEVSYRKGHRYLTVVADHDRDGAVVWAAEGKDAAALEAFYDQLGPERVRRLQAVSLDMGSAYAKATRTKAPQVTRCIDPFHVVALANDALDTTRRWAWNQARQGRPAADPRGRRRHPLKAERHARFRQIKHSRWALLKDPARLKDSQHTVLEELRRSRHVLWRGYEIKESLRDLYRLDHPADAARHLDAWLARTCRCRIPAMVKLSQTIRKHREHILAAIELGLSNSKLEGLNSKIRLINHRGYGHHSAAAVIAMIYLCCSGLTITLPTGS